MQGCTSVNNIIIKTIVHGTHILEMCQAPAPDKTNRYLQIAARKTPLTALLADENGTWELQGKTAKSLRKDGGLRKGQAAAETIVAFVGIRRTSRAALIDVNAIMREAQASLPVLIGQQLR